jgi:hypothetical protein
LIVCVHVCACVRACLCLDLLATSFDLVSRTAPLKLSCHPLFGVAETRPPFWEAEVRVPLGCFQFTYKYALRTSAATGSAAEDSVGYRNAGAVLLEFGEEMCGSTHTLRGCASAAAHMLSPRPLTPSHLLQVSPAWPHFTALPAPTPLSPPRPGRRGYCHQHHFHWL